MAGERGLEGVRGEGRSLVLLAELREENLAAPALGCVGLEELEVCREQK